jgi:hypothetical protein
MKKGKKSLKIPKGDNQNPYIEEEQTTQWLKEKRTKGQTAIYFRFTDSDYLPLVSSNSSYQSGAVEKLIVKNFKL